MKKSDEILPTKAELAILRVLWDLGPATVREVRDALRGEHSKSYATVLKLMQLMHEKGLVTRDESEMRHIYGAAEPASETQGHLVRDFVRRAFGGSAKSMMLRALSEEEVPAAELEEIRRELDAYLQGKRS